MKYGLVIRLNLYEKLNIDMDTIVFDTSVDGHHLEYLHHIYCLCCKDNSSKFVFVIPQSFNAVKIFLDWPVANNIVMDYITSEEKDAISYSSTPKATQKVLSNIINARCRKHNIYHVFSNMLIGMVPFAPLFLNRKVKLSGIIYDIYDYQQERHPSIISKFPMYVCYQIISHCPIYRNIMLLNDKDAPSRLNKHFQTKKFLYIPDPYIPLPTPTCDMYQTLQIPQEKKIFAHIGSMSKRKGTMLCLNAIDTLSDKVLSNAVFIFAGHFGHFGDEFYERLKSVNPMAQIIIHDEFCPFEYLANICSVADYILLPYLETERSSGILGYAAQFNTPVIGPSSGLIGKLIKEYGLGIQLEVCNESYLADAITFAINNELHISSNNYCAEHTVDSFQKYLKHIFY